MNFSSGFTFNTHHPSRGENMCFWDAMFFSLVYSRFLDGVDSMISSNMYNLTLQSLISFYACFILYRCEIVL